MQTKKLFTIFQLYVHGSWVISSACSRSKVKGSSTGPIKIQNYWKLTFPVAVTPQQGMSSPLSVFLT